MTTMRERLIAAIDREANRYIREAGDYVGLADVPYELFVDAVLAELEQPSEGMVKEMFASYFTLRQQEAMAAWAKEQTIAHFRTAFTAAIKAAREWK